MLTGEVSRSDLKVFRERLGCDHILGGDEDVIDFWLALSGGCDKERHARLHKRMWEVINSRPYRCLNHGDGDARNIFKVRFWLLGHPVPSRNIEGSKSSFSAAVYVVDESMLCASD